jgi:CheY-like chemotaxis protein
MNTLINWEDKTILIGEDELVNYRLLEMILSKTKVKLLHGSDGAEVLSLFKNNSNISLILMDIKMPVMDGIETIQEIRKLNKSIPVIAQTAYTQEDEKDRCLNLGFNGYISKPINRIELIELIQKHMND